MKGLVVLLGLVTASLLPGVAAVTVRIRAYNATGELDIRRDPFTLGTRVLLTCDVDVTGLPEGSEALSYTWYRNCTIIQNSRCEIRDGDPYYRVVSDTLLIDVTSQDQGGRYYCTVHGLQGTKDAITRNLSVASNTAPFLYTRTSLLPEHSVLTDVQQATGRNGQQWITCRSGGQGTRPQIWMRSELVASSSTANTVTIGLGIQRSNGLYHCLSAQSQRQSFSLFLRNSVTLPTLTVSANDSSMWTLTSPDGSRVERYIVEFECRVRNMTFVEKYMSVSASGGTGRVATSASCFRGLGHLHRVKVWAVSGPNISPAQVCIPDGQCKEEAPTAPATLTPTPVSTDNSTRPTDSGTEPATEQPDGTFIGVGVGVAMFLLLVLLTSVVVLILVVMVVVVVKRKGANKQKRHRTIRNNLQCNNSVVVMSETKKREKGVGPTLESIDIYDTADGNEYVENGMDEEDCPMGFPPIEAVEQTEHRRIPAPKKNFIPTRAEDGCNAMNTREYDLPMRKTGMTTNGWDGVIVSCGVEEGEQRVYGDTLDLTYRSETHSVPWQLSRGGYRY